MLSNGEFYSCGTLKMFKTQCKVLYSPTIFKLTSNIKVMCILEFYERTLNAVNRSGMNDAGIGGATPGRFGKTGVLIPYRSARTYRNRAHPRIICSSVHLAFHADTHHRFRRLPDNQDTYAYPTRKEHTHLMNFKQGVHSAWGWVLEVRKVGEEGGCEQINQINQPDIA